MLYQSIRKDYILCKTEGRLFQRAQAFQHLRQHICHGLSNMLSHEIPCADSAEISREEWAPCRRVVSLPGGSTDGQARTTRRASPTERSGLPDGRLEPARRTLRAGPADQSGRPESTNGRGPSPPSPRTKGRRGSRRGKTEKSLGTDEKVLEAFQKVLWTN